MGDGGIRLLPRAADLASVEAVFVLFVYSGRFKTMPLFRSVPGDLTVLLLAATLGAVGLALLRGRLAPPPLSLGVVAMLLFAELAVASVFWSSLDAVNIEKAQRFAVLTGGSFFIACMLGRDAVARARLLRLIVLLSVFILGFYLYERFLVGSSDGSIESGALDRIPAETGTNYVENAEHAWLIFVACLVLAVLGSARQYVLGLAGLAAAGVVLTITGGRGPLLLSALSVPLLAAVVVMSGARVGLRLGRIAVMLALLMGAGVVGYAVVTAGSEERAEQFHTFRRIDAQVSGEATRSVDLRDRGRQHAVDQWLARPLLGWGIGEFTIQDADLRYPHNLLLEILMEMGLAGAVLFLAAVGAGVLSCLRLGRGPPLGWAETAFALIFLTDLSARLTVQGYLADDRMFFAYLGLILGCAAPVVVARPRRAAPAMVPNAAGSR